MSSPNPPRWLTELTQVVTARIVPMEILPPLGCHYFRGEELWEVTLFAARTEVIGGERDGFQFPAGFVLDIGEILGVFTEVRSVQWQALPYDAEDEIGAHLAIEGVYAGQPVLLRVSAQAPGRFGIGRYANVNQMRLVDAW